MIIIIYLFEAEDKTQEPYLSKISFHETESGGKEKTGRHKLGREEPASCQKSS